MTDVKAPPIVRYIEREINRRGYPDVDLCGDDYEPEALGMLYAMMERCAMLRATPVVENTLTVAVENTLEACVHYPCSPIPGETRAQIKAEVECPQEPKSGPLVSNSRSDGPHRHEGRSCSPQANVGAES